MFGKLLALAWAIFLSTTLVLAILRKVLGSLPHIYALKPILFFLIMTSIGYGIFVALHRIFARNSGG